MRRVRVRVRVTIELDVENDDDNDTVLMLAEQVVNRMTEDSGREDDGWVPEDTGAIEAEEIVSDSPIQDRT